MSRTVKAVNLGMDSCKIADETSQTKFETVTAEYERGIIRIGGSEGIYLESENIVAGREALTYGRNPTHPQNDDWVETPIFLQLFRAALSCVTEGSETVRVVLSLPIEVYRHKEDTVYQAISGIHSFKRGGRPLQHVTVENPIILPECVAAGLGEAFDQHGTLVNQAMLQSRVGVIDIGSKHVNLADLINGRDVPHNTRQLEGGCWTIAADVGKTVSSRIGRTLTEYEARDILHTKIITHEGQKMDCSKDVDRAAAKFAGRLVTEIVKIWQDWKSMDFMLLTGGGVHLVGKALLDVFKFARAVNNPVYANAVGLLRYGLFAEREGL